MSACAWIRFQRVLVFTLSVLATAALSPAQPASRIGVASPVAGLASGQTGRVNALNLGSPKSTATSSCAVTLRFLKSDGTTFAESTVTIINGKTALLDLPYQQTGATARVALRAELRFGAPTGTAPGPDVSEQFDCNIVPSLEIFNSSNGHVSIVVTDWQPVLGADPRMIAKSRR